MKNYREYLIRQVGKAKIDVRLGVMATPEAVEQERPDTVIVAIGAVSAIPPIPGVDSKKVVTAVDLYGHEEIVGEHVVIIGGGMVGCETALHLTHLGKTVDLVEMGEMLAPEGIFTERIHTLDYMDKEPKLNYQVDTRCTEITEAGVKVVGADGVEKLLLADTIVLAAGMKARAEERETFMGCAYDVIPIGDCIKAGTVHDAVAGGFNAALIQ